jgi:hypothetical protein
MPLILLLIVIALFAWFLLRRPAPQRDDAHEIERRLLHLCLGDRKLCERLIEAERRRAPGIARAEAVDRACTLLSRSKS